jgi:glycosyltransferase involved in cell wall biosynthesis
LTATAAPNPDAPGPVVSAVALPLVSVIIVNYNYGRFLEAAVASVMAQTYPRCECIVVDNASTDDSAQILMGLKARHPELQVIERDENDGQTAASLDGLKASRGVYVIFADADDLLLPHCVETHVLAFLTLRPHVGFTSGDMLQIQDDQVVVSTGEDFNRYIRSGKGAKAINVRPFRALGDRWPSDDLRTRLEGRIHLVPPFHSRWIWSPTTGLCYRRDALDVFADNPALASLRTGTDMYFAHAIGALCGSALIDEPLFAYRLHGGNMYSKRAQLDRTLAFQPGASGDSNASARLMIVDHLVANASRFAPNIWLKLNMLPLLVRLDCRDPDPTKRRWMRHSRLAQRLVDHAPSMRSVLGLVPLAALMLWSGVPPLTAWRALASPSER